MSAIVFAHRHSDGPYPSIVSASSHREEQDDTDRGDAEASAATETDELGGFFGKLGDAVVVKVYARDVKSNLANAKTLLEA